MRLDRKLNLVIPITRESGTIYVYSMPIAKEVFEQYFMVISKTFSALARENLGWLGGPRVAAMMLRDIAMNTARGDRTANWWEGADGVEMGLLGEIRRLTNVFAPKDGGGWALVQYEDAISRKMLDEEEISEVEAAAVFFIVNSSMHRREARGPILEAAAGLWGWRITSSPISEFRSSLTTSTEVEDIGKEMEPLPSPSQLSIAS